MQEGTQQAASVQRNLEGRSGLRPYSMNDQPLGDGLVVRALRADKDVERVAALHSSIFGPGMTTLVGNLFLHHPQRPHSHWLYVEDAGSGQAVAGLCLLPWTLHVAGVELRAAEMGIVSTDERYRKRGLIRALNERFNTYLHEDRYDLSIIQGIPYFYRQFDYHYAMPLEAWCRVELHQFSAAPPAGYSFRQATAADIPALMGLYAAAAADLTISTQRNEAIWQYLLGPGMQTETAGMPWLLSGPDGTTAGYLRVMETGFGDGLICGEASHLSAEAATASLHWLTDLARRRHKPYLRLNLPKRHILNQVAQARGAADWRSYAWQVHIPNPPVLLRKLAPVFEQRIAASPFAGLTRDLKINLYRQAIKLQFNDGLLTDVGTPESGAPNDLQLPPDMLAPLLFGWRNLSEIQHMHPDAYAGNNAHLLIDTLFPPVEAFLYQTY